MVSNQTWKHVLLGIVNGKIKRAMLIQKSSDGTQIRRRLTSMMHTHPHHLALTRWRRRATKPQQLQQNREDPRTRREVLAIQHVLVR